MRIEFWNKIQSLPEEARRMLALFLIAVAAVSLLWLSSKFISSRLAVIAPGESPEAQISAQPPAEPAETEPLSPFAGIVDTLKSIEELWKP